MNLITRDTDYAVRALCFIAKAKPGRISVSELTARLRIPRAFLRKILQRLNKEKVLRSYKGQGGGFKLALSPARISLFDLIEIFQGSLNLQEHVLRKHPCPHIKKCKLKKKMDRIEKYVFSELKNITLASLIGKRG